MSTVFFAFVEFFAHFIWTILYTCLSGMTAIVMMKIMMLINVIMMLMLMVMMIIEQVI